jgi:ABC-2 type transport system permease protein
VSGLTSTGAAGDVSDPATRPVADDAVGHLVAVSRILVWRSFLGTTRIPATIIPIIIMPIFFVLAFSGSFSALTELPLFPTDNILNWNVPFAILQGASFAGLGAAFGAGKDLETGFYDRLLLAPTRRLALVTGPLSYSMLRAMLPLAIVVPVGYLGGARMVGGVLGYVTLVVAALGVAGAAGLWGLGVAYRTRTQRSGALIQVGIFMALFLSTGQVPLDVMTGWLHEVASVNPFTQVLEMARQGYLGSVTWGHTWPGLVSLAGMWAVLGLFAGRQFRRLVP